MISGNRTEKLFTTRFEILGLAAGLRTVVALQFNTLFIAYSSTAGLWTAVAHQFNT